MANNLKFKIAESLDIQVVKKRRDDDSRPMYDLNRNERRHDNIRNNWNNNPSSSNGKFMNRDGYTSDNYNGYY